MEEAKRFAGFTRDGFGMNTTTTTATTPLQYSKLRKNTPASRNILKNPSLRFDMSSSNSAASLPSIHNETRMGATTTATTTTMVTHSALLSTSSGGFPSPSDLMFSTLMSQFKRHSSHSQLGGVKRKPSHRPEGFRAAPIEQAHVTGFKKIDESIPPRVSRLRHAVEDRDTKMSREILARFMQSDGFQNACDPKTRMSMSNDSNSPTTTAKQFQLICNETNIPKIQKLMCHYIDSHKVYFNRDVVRLPKYEKTAPFFVDTMQFADNYLDDQQIVKKRFGYDQENLKKNHLVLEKVYLERLVLKSNAAGISPVKQMPPSTQYHYQR